jgi:hypothetical protein
MLETGNKIVEFVLPLNKVDPNGHLDGDLSISVENVGKFLDTNTMKVKSHTLQEYVNGKINTINSMQNVGGLDLSLVLQKYQVYRHGRSNIQVHFKGFLHFMKPPLM